MSVTLFVACVAYALFPLVQTVPLIAAIAFLLGPGPGRLAAEHDVAHPAPHACRAASGEALGVRTTVMNMSHTFLPLLFGGVGTALGMGPVFWAMALCLAGRRRPFARRRRRGG